MDFNTFSDILDALAEEIPPELYKDLSGGIVLSEKAKLHKKSVKDDLYVLGEYIGSRTQGRHIVIYYGSFMKLYADSSESFLKHRLRKTLRHEFLHHAESLAGEYGLEIEDKIKIEKYLERHNK